MQTLIPHLTKRDVSKAIVAVPSISEQENLTTTQEKFSKLKSAIDKFEKEIALNPTSSHSIQKQLDNIGFSFVEVLTACASFERNLTAVGCLRQVNERIVNELPLGEFKNADRLSGKQTLPPEKAIL